MSLKSLTLGEDVGAKQKKAVYAVTVETLKYYTVLAGVVEGVKNNKSSSDTLLGRLSMPTACVLARELLLSDGFSERFVGPAERIILDNEVALRAGLAAVVEARGGGNMELLLPRNAMMAAAGARKRTVRVNAPLVAGSVEEVLGALREEFGGAVCRNAYVGDVLELPAGSDLHAHRMVKDGRLVLQSLASCMPAVALMEGCPNSLVGAGGWTVVDACAAPGNKTTHVASLMAQRYRGGGGGDDDNGGAYRVYAFDRDPVRLERLKGNVDKTQSGGIVTAMCADFLRVDPSVAPYDQVDAVLLDPSCSGSGTSGSRMDYLLPSAQEVAARGVMYTDERVEQLSAFQVSAILHAMSFPKVTRLVYSTCSVYVEENERVVARVMAAGRAAGFELVACIPTWPRRGMAVREDGDDGLSEADAAKVVRVDPLEDGTDGFFVCAWARGRV